MGKIYESASQFIFWVKYQAAPRDSLRSLSQGAKTKSNSWRRKQGRDTAFSIKRKKNHLILDLNFLHDVTSFKEEQFNICGTGLDIPIEQMTRWYCAD